MNTVRYVWEQMLKPVFSPVQISILLVIVLAGLLDKRCSKPAPAPARIDSTAYYKQLEQQTRLTAELERKINYHNALIKELYERQDSIDRAVDELSGDALQREIDRQFNNPGLAPPARPAPHRVDRGRGAAGPPVQKPIRNSGGSISAERGTIIVAGYGPEANGFDCLPLEQSPAIDQYSATDLPAGLRNEPAETARSQVGELGVAGRGSRGAGAQAARCTRLWQLIRAQGYVYPDVAWAISAVETGYWSEQTAVMKAHNLFAFKANRRRNYVAVGKGGYVVFASRQACLDDYGAYEQAVIQKYGLCSRRAYLAHICQRFCPNPRYRRQLDLAFQKLAAIGRTT
ncbi:glucosaminidase domain-containing protein [Rudanella lutea]|uniref:glucosaminidase domain-containing protein n=1 Tax=Rudanella lutea TaxID=451374 RepID=UPI00036A1F25|nr:glucosaminidase domain-containing protein [Rudanella lutea]